jgi:hypothetical protein
MSSKENPIASSNDNQMVARRVDHHRILEAIVQRLDDLVQPELVRRRDVAEVPCTKELHQEESDEPARHAMIALRFGPQSLRLLLAGPLP